MAKNLIYKKHQKPFKKTNLMGLMKKASILTK